MSRTIVITGASRGIGAAIAAIFQADAEHVVSLDREAPDNPIEGVRYLDADVSNPAEVANAIDQIEQIDVLVNNAGIARAGRVDKQPPSEFIEVISTNLIGTFLCCAHAVPHMTSGGSIVSISSAVGTSLGLPGRSAYSAAKAGIVGLTRTLAVELAPRGIRANAVCPGWTKSPLLQQGIDSGALRPEWMLRRIPAGRLGEVEDVAAVVHFLAGESASYLTGQAVVVDGGWSIQGIDETPDWLRG